MKKIIFTMFLFASFLFTSSAVNSATINSLEITGGTLEMSGIIGTLNPAAFSNMTIGGYDGSEPLAAGTEASYISTSIATLEWGVLGPAAVYTAQEDGIYITNAPAVSGDITDNILTLDLSAWTLYWIGTSINVGSSSSLISDPECNSNCTSPIVTTYNANDGTFTASWDGLMVGGAHNGGLTQWNITGNVSVVPIPAAAWLFGSGLIGLIGLTRLKKAKNLISSAS